MSSVLLFILVGIPIAIHLLLVGVAYFDAKSIDMNARKWALITLLVPVFGFFTYLFERSERSYDPETDPYAGGGYNFHESHTDGEQHDPSDQRDE